MNKRNQYEVCIHAKQENHTDYSDTLYYFVKAESEVVAKKMALYICFAEHPEFVRLSPIVVLPNTKRVGYHRNEPLYEGDVPSDILDLYQPGDRYGDSGWSDSRWYTRPVPAGTGQVTLQMVFNPELWFVSYRLIPEREQGPNWAVYVKGNQRASRTDIAVVLAHWLFPQHPDVEAIRFGCFDSVVRRKGRSADCWKLCPTIVERGAGMEDPQYEVECVEKPYQEGDFDYVVSRSKKSPECNQEEHVVSPEAFEAKRRRLRNRSEK